MPASKVRARTQSIKLSAVIFKEYDQNTMPSVDALEANGLCVMAGVNVVLPVATYEAICDMLGGIEC